MTGPNRFRTLWRLAGAVLGVVMIAVIAHALRRDGPAALAAWRGAHVAWAWVIFAILCALAGQAINVVGWRRLLRDSGIDASLWTLMRLFLVSNLGRYLPAGKAWQMAIVAMIATEERLPAALVAASSFFLGVVGVGVGAIIVFAAGRSTIGLPPAWLVLPLFALLGLLFAPIVIRALPRLHEAIRRRVPGIDSLDAWTMWALIWTSSASWILWGTALLGLAKALLPASTTSITTCVAAWTGSFLAGLIAFVSPAGLGAREAVMQVVLTRTGMMRADALVLVVVSRVWVTLLDIIPAALFLVLRRASRGPVNDLPPVPARTCRASD